jgi:hypothetical protein
MNSPSAPDQAIEAAAKAGFDINLIECNLALPIEERWRQHNLALAMALELQQARLDRDARLRSTPASPR